MPLIQSKPSNSGGRDDKDHWSGDAGNRYDYSRGGWQDFDRFAVGFSNGPQVLAINGYANTSVDIGLQAAIPADHASIKISLGTVVNLDAFANAGASGTVTSTASNEGLLTLTNGSLKGTYTASMTINVTAYIAAYNASVSMQITEQFQFRLSGTGYVGASLDQTSSAGGTVVATTPHGNSISPSAKGGNGTFDLARFTASVLNTGKWDVAFLASSRSGEALQGFGTSVLTISAIATVPGSHSSEQFNKTERSSVAFNETASPAFGGYHGPGDRTLAHMFSGSAGHQAG